ncbi:MAG TPA: hypothetical protein VJN94_00340 [Candidatus Binataceae bacterium]|nr:hypothetical protein [Candidatus Binataceae bacterium]
MRAAYRTLILAARHYQLPLTSRRNCVTLLAMKTSKLTEVLERVESWPADVQNELAEFALELDAGLKDGEYQPTPEELAGIDRGLRAAAEGCFASEQEVEAAFAKFRAR